MKESDVPLLKILLESIASQALLPSLKGSGAVLPDGWVQITAFASKPPLPTVPVQGLIAMGPVNDDFDLGIVLALGITWANFYKCNTFGFPLPPFDQKRLPSAITGTSPGDATIATVFEIAYESARRDIWAALALIPSQHQDLPVFIAGMSLGAPMAQICSIDLRKGNTGPDGQAGPIKLEAGNVFSAPNFSSASFANYYSGLITSGAMPAQFVTWAASSSITADFFPTSPTGSSYMPLGKLQYIDNILLPTYDVPWWERSDVYYLQSLGGTPLQNAVVPVSFSNQPAGFSRDLAYTLSLLVAVTYQMAQHPNSVIKITIDPYKLYKTINSNGVPIACIFTSSDAVVVAFRGTTTFKELYALTCLSTFSPVTIVPDPNAQVHAGTYGIYTAPVDGASGAPFSTTIIGELKNIAQGKKVFITGHDIGGAVAAVAATDYAVNNYGFSLTALYTFGSTYFGNLNFSNCFNTSVASKSYLLLRLNDKTPNPILNLGYFPTNQQITMFGQLAIEDSTYHSIAGYINLLNTGQIVDDPEV